MNSEPRHVVCPACGARNRMPQDKPLAAGKCGRCHAPLFTQAPVEVSDGGLEKHLRGDDIPVVVDFWAPWCGPCRAMAPAYARVAAELEPKVRLLKLNTEDYPAVAQQFGIRGIPTLMLFRNGERKAQVSGAMDARSLVQWITTNL